VSRALTEVGFYGKLPCRGDFLQRRAPQDFVDVWDGWLQECIHESRQRLQESWLETYLTAPVWRFVLSAGVCGEGVYAGILVPSVDRVGRYFPLTVIAQLAQEDCPLSIACGSADWFEGAEALVLDALESQALDFDTFDERIALLRERLNLDSFGAAVQHPRQLLEGSEFPAVFAQWHMPMASADSLQSAVNAFAYREMSRALQPLAIWWTQGSRALSPSWLATRALPSPRAFVAMLTGVWADAEWATIRSGGPA
jgi:type VI secretion system protein ImpM